MRVLNFSQGLVAILAVLFSASTNAATCRWLGAVGNAWNTNGNWDCLPSVQPVPVTGDALVFPAVASNKTNVNDISGLSVVSVTVDECGYAISGNPISLTGSDPLTLNCSIASGTVSLSTTLTLLGTNPITLRTNLVGAMDASVTLGNIVWSGALRLLQTAPPASAIATTLRLTESSPSVANRFEINGGTVTFLTPNSISGPIEVKSGGLIVQNINALGVSAVGAETVVSSGAFLASDAAGILEPLILLDDVLLSPRPVLFLPPAISPVNAWNGDIQVAGGALARAEIFAGPTSPGASSEVGGVISGSGDGLIVSEGPLLLKAANTYSGAIVVEPSAVLEGTVDNVLSDTSELAVGPGATYIFSGGTDQIGTLTIAGTLDLTGGLTSTNSTPSLISGTVTGAGDLIKAGSGDLDIDGDFAASAGSLILQSGITTLAAGSVLRNVVLEGDARLITEDQTVSGFSGAVGSGSTLDIAGANSSPIGTFHANGGSNCSLSANNTLEFDVQGGAAGQFDEFLCSGSIILSNTKALFDFTGSNAVPGTPITIVRSLISLSGTFDALPNNSYVPSGSVPSKYQVNYLANSITLTRAPILNANAIPLTASPGVGFSQSITPTGGQGAIVSAVLSSGPAWLSGVFNAGALMLSGSVPAGASGNDPYTVIVTDSIGQTVSQTGTITYAAGGSDFTWNGSVNNNWNTADNWTPANVPTPGSILRFPIGAANQNILNAPGGVFDYAELAGAYVISGGTPFVFTNNHAIRFNEPTTALSHWNTPIQLNNPNALVTLNSASSGQPTLILGNNGGLDFTGNLRFEFSMQAVSDPGFTTIEPRYALNAQTGNVAYVRMSGSGEHLAKLEAAANYTGLTMGIGPNLKLSVRNAQALGSAASQTDTMITDATLEIFAVSSSLTIALERLLTNNVNTISSATLAADLVDGANAFWTGPIQTTGSFANFDADGGTLQIDGVIGGSAQARFGANGSTNGVIRLTAQNNYAGTTEINTQTIVESTAINGLPARAVFFVDSTSTLSLEAATTLGGLEGVNGGLIQLENAQLTLQSGASLVYNGSINQVLPSEVVLTGLQTWGGTLNVTGGLRLSAGGRLTLQDSALLNRVQLDGGRLVVANGSTATVSNLAPFTGSSTGIIDLGVNTLAVSNGALAPGVQVNVTLDGSVPVAGRLAGTVGLNLAGATLQFTQLSPLAVGTTVDLATAPLVNFAFANALPDSIISLSGSNYKVLASESSYSLKRLGTLSNVLTVNTTADSTITGFCSLRNAVISISTNEAPAGSACDNGAPNATIQFAPTVTGVITLTEGLGVDAGMTIQGPGARVLTINGNAGDLFAIDQPGAPVQVVIADLRLFNGSAAQGGAIFNTQDLTLRRVHFDSNVALNTIEGLAVGGAIFNDGNLLVESSTFTNNSAISSGTLNGARGGAIHSLGNALIVNSTFDGNFTRSLNDSAAGVNSCGGAVSGNADIRFSTLARNRAESLASGVVAGGGICAFASDVIALQHTVLDDNTVVIGGTATAGPMETFVDAMASASADFSLAIDLPPTATISNAITGNPLLLPIADNGGPVDTIAFERESVLKDAGGAAPPTPPAIDARGRARISGVAIDIGAFEQNLSITASLPDGAIAAPYSQALVVAPSGTYVFAPENTVLLPYPPGLTLSASGVLSGTPTQLGTYSFSLSARSASGDSIYATYSITISNAPPITTNAAFSAIAPVPFAPGVTYAVNATVSATSVPQGTVSIQAARLDQPTLTISCTPSVVNAINAINASCTLAPPTPGVWVTSVTFVGTAPYQGSTGTINAIVTATLPDVEPAQSLTQTVVGQPFQVSAAYQALAGWPIPRGQVTVTQFPAAVQATGSLNAAGAASVNLISRSAVTKALLVTYLDNVDQVYNTQTVAIPHTTLRASTTTTISLSAPQGPPGQAVTVNYTIGVVAPGAVPPGASGPSGRIEIRDGIDVAICNLSALSGSCSFTPTTLGVRSIFARFVGDAEYEFSDSTPLSYTVGQVGSASDVSVTIGNAVRLIRSTSVTYTVTVRNLSNASVGGVRVENPIPAGALSQSVVNCAASANSTCGNAANTSGNLDRVIDLAANGEVTYRVSVQLDNNENPVSSTATATLPAAISDPNLSNNTATDTDPRGIMGSGFEDDFTE